MNRDLMKNKRIHGSDIFPLDLYSINCSGKENMFDCHYHEEMEFIMINEGKAMFQLENCEFEICSGEAVFVNCGEIHAAYAIDNIPCSFSAVVFNISMLYGSGSEILISKYFQPILTKKYTLPVHIKGKLQWEKEVIVLLNELIHVCISKPYAYEMLAKSYLYQIFSCILPNGKSTSCTRKNLMINNKSKNMKKVITYIQENYKKKISIEDLVLLVDMSKGYFYRFFKQVTKKTPIDFINNYRIHKAISLLGDSNKKVIEVSLEVGFENISYFISTFKKYMLCTPAEYQKLNG